MTNEPPSDVNFLERANFLALVAATLNNRTRPLNRNFLPLQASTDVFQDGVHTAG